MDTSSRLEKAVLAIKNLNKKINDFSQDIAIIGMSCKFPGADNVQEFWSMLQQGKDGIQEVPPERWRNEEYYNPDIESPGYIISKNGGFIKNIEEFDARFFNIGRREAEYLDPQHRLLLEQTWLALESASIAAHRLRKTDTGVFIGMMTHDYSMLLQEHYSVEKIESSMAMGLDSSAAAGRISYNFGFRGPCLSIQTACSSSLVAFHEACKSLQRGESSLAIVGGVNAILNPRISVLLSKAGMLSPSGYCHTFDENADGYVRGEGCGVLVLKRLSDATRDNDRILAVVKASGINHGGASSGLTVPNGEAQEDLLRRVLCESQLKSDDITYIECHGTGTRLGDPIEVEAISQVYGKNRSHPLKLGTVKSNIGHLEGAAGIAGLIKTILALQHGEIPKNLHFNQLNAHIQLNFPAQIVTENYKWDEQKKTRRAAVSSFGVSGVNAHVILEEAPTMATQEQFVTLPTKQLFVLSAKSLASLTGIIQLYIHYLNNTQDAFADICYTAAISRDHFSFRLALIATNKEELLQQLESKELNILEANSLDERFISDDLAELSSHYLSGYQIDWSAYYQPYLSGLSKVTVPGYCFDRQRYWLDINQNDKTIVHQTELTTSMQSDDWAHFLKSAPIQQRQILLMDKIRDLVAQQLKLDNGNEININKPFIELGINSISASSLGLELGKALVLKIPLSLLWEYNTIHLLSDYLLHQLKFDNSSENAYEEKNTFRETPGSFHDVTRLTASDIEKYGILMGIVDEYLAQEQVAFDTITIENNTINGSLEVLSYFKLGVEEGIDWKWNLSLFSTRIATLELFSAYVYTLFPQDEVEGIYIKNIEVELVRAIYHKKDIAVSLIINKISINHTNNELEAHATFSFSENAINGPVDFTIKLNKEIKKNNFEIHALLNKEDIKQLLPIWEQDISPFASFSFEDIKVGKDIITAIVNKKIPMDNYFTYTTINNLLHIGYLVQLMYLYAGWDNKDRKWKNREVFGISSHEKNALSYFMTDKDTVAISVKNKVEAYDRILYEFEIHINGNFKMTYIATIKYFNRLDVFSGQ